MTAVGNSSNELYLDTTGTLVTTTYAEAVSSSEKPPPQVTGIVQAMTFDSSIQGEDGANVAMNAFIADKNAPAIWLDSDFGEVVQLELFDITAINAVVEINATVANYPNEGAPITNLLRNVTKVYDGSTVVPTHNMYPYAVPVYTSKLIEIPIQAGVPYKYQIPSGNRPWLRISAPTGTKIYVEKTWGRLTSDSYMFHQLPGAISPTSGTMVIDGKAIDWQNVWTTIGKVIKVIGEVAKVVIPFIVAVVLKEPLASRNSQRIEAAIKKAAGKKLHNVQRKVQPLKRIGRKKKGGKKRSQ